MFRRDGCKLCVVLGQSLWAHRGGTTDESGGRPSRPSATCWPRLEPRSVSTKQAISWGVSREGSPKRETVAPRRVGARRGPEGWGGAKISCFFATIFFLVFLGSFRGILVVFEAPEPQMCAFGVLRLSCETPALFDQERGGLGQEAVRQRWSEKQKTWKNK